MVSIVIVSMNNVRQLYPCLDSIRQFTHVPYEIWVVAYMFSPENLLDAKQKYPRVHWIESHEIRGFSENNNLALRQVTGEYTFVLNDDTYFTMPVIDQLVDDFSLIENFELGTLNLELRPKRVAILSPRLDNPDGSVQVCGRPPYPWISFIFDFLCNPTVRVSDYVNQKGLFQSYNIIGAAFLIRTEVFKSMGWFDENYFFTPEDIALSTRLNLQGWQCWVDADASLVHLGGMSGKSTSMTQTALMPAAVRGTVLFYTSGKPLLRFVTRCLIALRSLFKILSHGLRYLFGRSQHHRILIIGNWNIFLTSFSSRSPKTLFLHYYQRLSH